MGQRLIGDRHPIDDLISQIREIDPNAVLVYRSPQFGTQVVSVPAGVEKVEIVSMLHGAVKYFVEKGPVS